MAALGSQQDMAERLRALLAPWFGPSEVETPILTAFLQGPAWALSLVYSLILFAGLQTRVATSTGGWLELSAYDYFGASLPRLAGEFDSSYQRRIRLEALRDRNTVQAIKDAVFDLTGVVPAVYEGFGTAGSGGWGTPGLALGVVGAWGGGASPAHVVVSMPLPQNYGIPNRGGWGSTVGGWGKANFSFVGDEDIVGAGATISDIFAAINRVRAAGVSIYVRFI